MGNSVLKMAGLPQLNLKIWQVQWAHYEVDLEVAELIPQAFHFRKEDNIDGGLYYIFPANATDVLSNRHLPKVGKRIDSYSSPYTMTDDSYFVMDKVHPKITIFAGGSGRAFKFGPLLGDCLSSLLTGDDSPIDLAPFSLKRGGILHQTDTPLDCS